MTTIRFIDTSLRDAHQSLWNGRMTTAMMLPIAPVMDEVGFEALDFMALISMDWCIRNQQENPWERLRLISRAMPHTPLIVGGVLRNFGTIPDSVTEFWMAAIARAGAGRIRINDPCHDIRQITKAIQWSKKAGLTTMAALIYSHSPVHTDAFYAEKALQMAKAGAERVFIKDVGGLLTPARTQTLVPAIIKKIDGLPLEIHGHCTTGLAPLCYLEAIKLGARTVHTAVAPLANGPSQPSAENILRNARFLGFSADVDEKALAAVAEHFRYVAAREQLPMGSPVEYDLLQYEHQLPGGMMSNYVNELKKRGLGNQLAELLKEIARIRRELGYPIMVTPLSQYVGAQAILNHTTGERYRVVTDEIIKYVLGHYGELDAPVEKEILDTIMRLPRTKELENWEPPQRSLEELRREVGNGLSDEEFLMRVLSSNQEAVSKVLAAGPNNSHYPRGDKPLLALIRELTRDREACRIHVRKKNFSLALE
jgi:oxaloacetate decarboxylase (Na+ extruding) subunit alpha